MIHFSCPKCDKHLKADPALAGQKTKCKKCGQVMVVPSQEPDLPASPAPAPPSLLQFTCPKCGKHLKADPALAGQKTKCKQCGQVLIVPSQEPEYSSSPMPVSPSPQPTSAPGAGGSPYDVQPTNPDPLHQALTAPATVSCPHCAGPVANDFSLAGQNVSCPHCGNGFLMPARDASPSQANKPNPWPMPQTAPATINCPHCGGPVANDFSMAGQNVGCPHCTYGFIMPGLDGRTAQAQEPYSVPMPPGPVTCPHCGGPVAKVAALAGQNVACPHCRNGFLMPAGDAIGSPCQTNLQGTWQLTVSEADGELKDDLVIRALEQRLTIEGRQVELTLFGGRSTLFPGGSPISGNRSQGTVSVNPTANPKEIDFTFHSGGLAGKTLKGIFQCHDRGLVICHGELGDSRPRVFKTKPGDNLQIDMYQKVLPALDSEGHSPGSCRHCGKKAYSNVEFEAECKKAGFIKDSATGKFKMRLGGLAGTSKQVYSGLARQEENQQETYDRIEGQRGYQCKGCGNVYCMNCLYAVAPAHPRGGKACPKCGDTFKHYERHSSCDEMADKFGEDDEFEDDDFEKDDDEFEEEDSVDAQDRIPFCVQCGSYTDLREFKYCGYEREEEEILDNTNGILTKGVTYYGLQNLTDWVCAKCISSYTKTWLSIGVSLIAVSLLAGIPSLVYVIKNWVPNGPVGGFFVITIFFFLLALLGIIGGGVLIRKAFGYTETEKGDMEASVGDVIAWNCNRSKLFKLGCTLTFPGHKGSRLESLVIKAMKRHRQV